MKISIYELLGMVKENKAPKEIKYDDEYYVFNTEGNSYYCCDHDLTPLFSVYNMSKPNFIFDEVEILEEEKKIPEKLKIEDDGNTITLFGEKENEWTILDNVDVIVCNKINSIIDYLKSKGE